MSYTLITLKAAREALLQGDTKEAMRRVNILIGRIETIIRERENFKPRCKKTQEIHYE